MRHSVGVLRTWNRDTFENEVERAGGVSRNVKVLDSVARKLRKGDAVAMLDVPKTGTVIVGELIVPGRPA